MSNKAVLYIDQSIKELTKDLDFTPPTIRGVKWPSLSQKNPLQTAENQQDNTSKEGASGCCTVKFSKNPLYSIQYQGVDWITLEIFTMREIEPGKGAFLFYVDADFHSGKNWQKIYKIITIANGKPETFATLETENYEQSYKNSHLKIENRFLYRPDLTHLLSCCFSELGFKFIAISRIDTYVDFQEFNPKNCTRNPENFIKQNFNNTYIKSGRASKLNFNQTREYVPEFVPIEFYSQETDKTKITGVRWGKRTTGFQIRMYNKTYEMQQKIHKPHIESTWKAVGFDMQKPVWRLEFEIHRKDFVSVDRETGTFINSMRDLQSINPENINKINEYLFYRHFKFHKRKITSQGKRITLNDRKRRLPSFYPMQLAKPVLIHHVEESIPSGRSEKIELTRLAKLYLQTKFHQSNIAENVKAVLAFRLNEFALHEWFQKRFEHINFGENFGCMDIAHFTNLSQSKIDLLCPTCGK